MCGVCACVGAAFWRKRSTAGRRTETHSAFPFYSVYFIMWFCACVRVCVCVCMRGRGVWRKRSTLQFAVAISFCFVVFVLFLFYTLTVSNSYCASSHVTHAAS